MTACPSEEQLAAYLAGALAPADAEQTRAHIEGCDKCRQWLDEARANDVVLDSVRRVMAGSDRNEGLVHGAAGSAAPIGPTYGSSRPLTSYPIIPGYDFLRELNRGGQGIVYQATQKSTKRSVAIKILLEGPFASPTAAKRFQREIELAAQLKHPTIITIFDSGVTAAGQPFYVMDYVEGLPLHHYVRDKKLNLEEVLSLFGTVCEGVQFAHQRGVIHRDLKPSNILVDREGRPKVLDFGLAKWTDAPADSLLSLTHQVVGTLPYMSPEQARGKMDEIDTRTDIYALGIILYELLTGHYPYPVVGQMAYVLKHISETPPTPPSRTWTPESGVTVRTGRRLRSGQCPIDDEVQTVILKALSKERERRYQSAGEFARDLVHYLAGEAIEARRDSGWYVLGKIILKHRVSATVFLLFIVMVVAFAGVMWTLRNKAVESERKAELTSSGLRKIARAFVWRELASQRFPQASDLWQGVRSHLLVDVCSNPATLNALPELSRLVQEVGNNEDLADHIGILRCFPVFAIQKQGETGSFAWLDWEEVPLHAGDRLQCVMACSRPLYFRIICFRGNGAATQIFPLSGSWSDATFLLYAPDVSADNWWAIDEATDRITIFVVACAESGNDDATVTKLTKVGHPPRLAKNSLFNSSGVDIAAYPDNPYWRSAWDAASPCDYLAVLSAPVAASEVLGR